MKGRRWHWFAWAAALPVLAAPVGDPDLWWHLSAGRWMAEHGAVPRADWLSFTLAGREWIDFEWLAQLAFYAVHAAGGPAGLWALKAALFAAAGAGVWAACGRLRAPVPWRAAGLAAWACAMLPRADLRTEGFSWAAFAWLLWRLEGRRGERARKNWRAPAAAFAFFALWANLHAGFVMGLGAIALYAAFERGRRARELWACAAAGAAGTLLNPYGLRLYGVLLRHGVEAAEYARYIAEWGGLSPRQPGHWPSLALAAACAVALWRGRRSSGALRAGLFLAILLAAALRHARMAAYLATAAVPLGLGLAARSGWSLDGRAGRRWAGALCLACALASGGLLWPTGLFRALSHDLYGPGTSAAYLRREPVLRDLKLFHPWGWGGRLGWLLAPETRVFADGRYIFSVLNSETVAAARGAESWRDFLDRRGIQAALMENVPVMMDTTRIYPDGGRRPFRRPYYLSYLPREEWALVHFDERALLFVRRDAVSPGWLQAREYRLHRPRDEAALGDALARGEVDRGALAEEEKRRRRTLAALSPSLD